MCRCEPPLAAVSVGVARRSGSQRTFMRLLAERQMFPRND